MPHHGATLRLRRPLLRYDRRALAAHFVDMDKRKQSKPHLQPVYELCFNICKRFSIVPDMRNACWVPGHGHGGQGAVNEVADALANSGGARGITGGSNDRAAVIYVRLLTEHIPWFDATDSISVRRRKSIAHRGETQRFLHGRPLPRVVDDVNPIGEGWPWKIADSWWLSLKRDALPPALLPPDDCTADASLSAPMLRCLRRWAYCIPPSTDAITGEGRVLLCALMGACARVAATHADATRRGAALLMYQLLPRMCLLRCGKSAPSFLGKLRRFGEGQWASLLREYYHVAIAYYSGHPQRGHCADLDPECDVDADPPGDAAVDAAPLPRAVLRADKRFVQLCRKGRYKDAVKGLVGEPPAPYNEDTLRGITALQFAPAADEPRFDLAPLRAEAAGACAASVMAKACLDPGPSFDEHGVDRSDGPLVLAHLRRAKTGSAADSTGHRLDFLRWVGLSIEPNHHRGLVLLICHVANGGLVADDTHFLATSALAAALAKASGGVRPLAIGAALRRMVCKVVLAKFSAPKNNIIAAALAPHQFAVGLPNGLDIMFNTVRLVLAVHEHFIAIGTDIKSAFQRMPRGHFLRMVRDHPTLGCMYPLFCTWYLFPTVCFYGDLFDFLSCEGAQQGCPLGSLAWCIGLDNMLRAVAQKFGTVVILAFADDIWVLGPPHDARAAVEHLNELLRTMRSEGGSLGFAITKFWAWSAGEDTLAALPPDFFPEGTQLIPANEGTLGLGAFMGACPRWLEAATLEQCVQRHTKLH